MSDIASASGDPNFSNKVINEVEAKLLVAVGRKHLEKNRIEMASDNLKAAQKKLDGVKEDDPEVN